VQQYLRMRDGVAPETYCMAPYLRAVTGRRQRKPLASCAQARTCWQWSLAAARARHCLVTSESVSDAAAARSTMRHTWCFGVRRSAHSGGEYASLFSPWPANLREFISRDPTAVAAFAYAGYKREKKS